MNYKQLSTLALLGSFFGISTAHAATQAYDPHILAQVEALYGLSEEAAISRLSDEYNADVQARRVEALNLPSFAGDWFDSTTQRLKVAASNKADFSVIERIGATAVLVDHSLTELEAARKDITNALTSAVGQGSVRESYVDVQTNAVVVGISKDSMTLASSFMTMPAHVNVPVHLTAVSANVGFSTNLRGADGTQNYTWIMTFYSNVQV